MKYMYLFTLGNHPTLSLAELTSVFRRWGLDAQLKSMHGKQALFSFETDIDAKKLMTELGGTVSIARFITDIDDHIQNMAEYLHEAIPDGKIQFSLHTPQPKELGLGVKKLLKSMNRSARYIEAKNTATIIHNQLIERKSDLTIWNKQLFVTVAVQDITNRSKRDYSRPGRDSKSGMLPPKLSQIMINLAEANKQDILLDAFCGSGTVLMEGMLLGYTNLVGTDLSAKAIEDSRKNIDWIIQEENIDASKIKIRIEKCASEKLAHILPNESVAAIVSEPYMGKALNGKESRVLLQQQAKALKQLYLESFEAFYEILKPQGRVVFIIPEFFKQQRWIQMDCIADIENIGFRVIPLTPEEESIRYHRKDQHLGRRIWRFEKI